MGLNSEMVNKIDDVLDKKSDTYVLNIMEGSNLPEERKAARNVFERRMQSLRLDLHASRVENSLLKGEVEVGTLVVDYPSISFSPHDERMQHVHIHFMGEKKETAHLLEKCVLIIKWSVK